MTTFSVVDCDGRALAVGDKIRVEGEAAVATVLAISEPDADYDDELQRGVLYPPKISAAYGRCEPFVIRTYETGHGISWADYPDGPESRTFEADEVSRIP